MGPKNTFTSRLVERGRVPTCRQKKQSPLALGAIAILRLAVEDKCVGALSDDGDGIDLDQAARVGGQLHHLNRGSGRLVVAEILGPDAVERILIG